ncbi:MAG: DNA primase [Candidatus Omnitrophota bacterium]
MIPNETIEKILDKLDIAEVVSAYIPLKKVGNNFKANCPFHKEKTPSFVVSASKQIYHCFGCGAGGNAIGFVMKHENMGFIDALKMLADKAGIALPRSSFDDDSRDSLAQALHGANDIACNLFQENLQEGFGKAAYGYFLKRGIEARIIKHFRLGFAEDSWQGLVNHARSKSILPDNLEQAGLAIKNESSGNHYDRFRNRVLFPIFDQRSRILGFGARALDNSNPKYINSPETHIYTKGKHLYGLNFAKESIRKQNYAIIVEGYFDLIMPFQHDIKNIVATLGTALTVDQIGALKRFTENAIMVYDSDKAGQEATLRGLDLLLEEDMNVRVAILPTGSDPDSFIRTNGKDAFMEILKVSKDLFDYKLGTLTAKFKKNEPRGKARIVREMLPTLDRIRNAVLRSGYLKKMSEELDIDEEAIRAESKKLKADRTYRKDAKRVSEERSENYTETMLLAMALEDTNYISRIERELGFGVFKDKVIVGVLEKILALSQKGKKITPGQLLTHFEDKESEEIISKAICLADMIDDKERVISDCFRHIKRHGLKDALNNMQFKIREAEGLADTSRVDELIAEYSGLLKGLEQDKVENKEAV